MSNCICFAMSVSLCVCTRDDSSLSISLVFSIVYLKLNYTYIGFSVGFNNKQRITFPFLQCFGF